MHLYWTTYSTNSLKLHHNYWNICWNYFDVFCIIIEKLVVEGLEHESIKVKTLATIQTRVSWIFVFLYEQKNTKHLNSLRRKNGIAIYQR